MVRHAATVLLLFITSTSAWALSCAPMEERFVLVCKAGNCAHGVAISDANSFGACARRLSVRDMDAEMAGYLGSLIAAESSSGSMTGTFEVSFSFPFYRYKPSHSLAALQQNLQNWAYRYDGKQPFSTLRAQEAVAVLSKFYGEKWVVQISSQEDLSLLSQRREEALSEGRKQLTFSVLYQILYWSSSILALVFLIHSVHTYYSRLHATEPRSVRVSPVAVQAIILGLSVGALFWNPMSFWPGVLLLPAVVVILLAEVWSSWSRRRVT